MKKEFIVSLMAFLGLAFNVQADPQSTAAAVRNTPDAEEVFASSNAGQEIYVSITECTGISEDGGRISKFLTSSQGETVTNEYGTVTVSSKDQSGSSGPEKNIRASFKHVDGRIVNLTLVKLAASVGLADAPNCATTDDIGRLGISIMADPASQH